MKLYFVSADPIAYKDDKGALLELTKESALASLNQKFGDKEEKRDVQVFATAAEAAEWAKQDQDPKDAKQHAVVELELDITEEDFKKLAKVTADKRLAKITDAEGKTVKVLDQFLVGADRLKLISISFKHADAAAKDVVYVEQPAADKKADPAKTSSILNTLKSLAFPVSIIGTVGAGFWYGNGVPAALSLMAKLVPAAAAIPAASIAAQVAISAAVGLLAYGAFLAAKAGVNALSTAWKKFNRTNKEKYTDDLAAEVAAISTLEKDKLGLKEDSSFVVALKDLLEKAPEATFDDKGVYAKDEPKAGNKLSLAQWEHAQLDKLVATKEEERAALKAEIRQGPKPTPSK